MPAGQTTARLLPPVLVLLGLSGCAATPQDSTGTVISMEPKICVTATTGADYCFDPLTVAKKVPGLQVGDCVVFAHTPPTSPGASSRLEAMERCADSGEQPDDNQNQNQ